MWGGKQGEQQLRDVWEWNGTEGRWTDRTPAVLPARWPPAPGRCPIVALDTRRNKLVLFNTTLEGYVHKLTAIWEWTPGAPEWTAVDIMSAPPISFEHVAYDSERRAFLTFGRDSDGAFATYETERTPGDWALRAPRLDVLLDEREPLSFGLTGGATGAPVLLGRYETAECLGSGSAVAWEWRGMQWRRRAPAPVPGVGPPVALDPARGALLAFGNADVVARTIWQWDAPTDRWIERTPTGAMRPFLRRSAAVVYDATRGKFMLFGGETIDPPQALEDLWELDLPR